MLHDIVIIGTLVVLEGLLSADNALVLAVLVQHLPKGQRQKALLYGIFGAFFFRFVGLLGAFWIIHFWYLRALGGGYLLYLSSKHFIWHASKGGDGERRTGPGFWRTVLTVELTDIAFAIDSILVGVGLSRKLWVVYLGGVLGIIAMRFAAGAFLRVLDRFPGVEHTAYALVGWISVKLLVESYPGFSEDILHNPSHIHLPVWLFWTVMGLIAVVGFSWAVYAEKKNKGLLNKETKEEVSAPCIREDEQ
ncbi:MAG: TerC family protein [bacterium]